jgi:hypothetical protein
VVQEIKEREVSCRVMDKIISMEKRASETCQKPKEVKKHG